MRFIFSFVTVFGLAFSALSNIGHAQVSGLQCQTGIAAQPTLSSSASGASGLYLYQSTNMIGLYPSMNAGSAIGIHMMMGLAPAMAMQERQQLELKVQSVLEGESDGRTITWRSPRTGQVVRLKPKNTRSDFREITVPRSNEVGITPASFKVEQGHYISPKGALLRPNPTLSKAVIDTIPEGGVVDVMGRVRGMTGESWLLVGAGGIGYGYVDPAELVPLDQKVAETKLYRRDYAGAARDPVSASVDCRELEYETDLGSETIFTCRAPDGKWVIDPPTGGNRKHACLPANQLHLLR